MDNASLKKIKSGFMKTTDRHQAGLACLASVIKYFGGTVEMQQLHVNSGAANNGVSLLGLCEAAGYEGFKANGFKGNTEAIKGLAAPVILHISRDAGEEDFIVSYGWSEDRFIIGDPQWGIVEYREDELQEIWKSNSLIFMEPGDSFKTADEKRQLRREWLFNLLKDYKRVLITTGVLGGACAAIFTYFISFVLDNLLVGENTQQLVSGFIWVFSILLLFIVASHFKDVFVLQGTKNLNLDLFARINNKVFSQNYDNESFSEATLSLFHKNTDRFSAFVFNSIAQVPFNVLLYLVTLVAISLISIWTGVISFVALVIFLFVARFKKEKIQQLSQSENEHFTGKAKTSNYASGNIQNIKLGNGEKRFVDTEVSKLKSLLESKINIKMLVLKKNNWIFIGLAAVLFTIFYVVLKTGENKILASELTFYSWLVINLFAIFKLVQMVIGFLKVETAYSQIYSKIGTEYFDNEENFVEDRLDKVTSVKKLEIRNLDFAFPGQIPVLNKVNIAAKIGDITVVDGATGSGKSVMVSVLSRLLPLQTGEILVNEISWDQFGDFNWKAGISSVLQPVQINGENVIENIGSGSNSFEPKKIISFCKEMGFHQFIKEFPGGYSTAINHLSAGQKQLIALATALYKKPKLLLLDEPFVFMDEVLTNFYMKLLHKLKNEIMIILFTGNGKVKSGSDKFLVYKLGYYNFS